MLSIGGLGVGSGNYFTFLAQQDYYLMGGEPPGFWWGEGANRLGLLEQVTREQLQQLLQGFSPDGKPLVQNAGSDHRRAGFDLTFSAPKSVSALWACSSLEMRAQIQAAHAAAVSAALRYIQTEATISRIGKQGAIEVRAQLVAALFDHCTSRALEPQLHTHALIMNVGVLPNGETNALFHPLLFQHKMAAGALYRAEFAVQLQHGPRLGLERSGFAFEVVGVPKSLCETWSTRRAEIKELLGAAGLDSAAAAAEACLESREAKTVVPPRAEMLKGWSWIGAEHGFTSESAQNCRLGIPPVDRDKHQPAVLDLAINRLAQECSHFTKRDLVRRVAEEAQTLGVGADEVRWAVDAAMKKHNRLVVVGPDRLTTKEILRIEKGLIRDCGRASRESSHGVDTHILERGIRTFEPPLHVLIHQAQARINDKSAAAAEATKSYAEKCKAVRMLTEKGGSIRVLEGGPGSGKTSTLGAARKVWEEGGYQVIGAAVANRAARELQNRAGIESMSVAKLLYLIDNRFLRTWGHHLHMIGREALKKPTFKLDPPKLNDRTVLVVDEASMLDTRVLAKLVKHVLKSNAMLVLVGDRQQLASIGPGGAFAHIADSMGKAALTTNDRQKNPEDKRMVRDLLNGNIEDALKNLAQRDRLVIGPNRKATVEMLVKDWFEKERGHFHDAQIYAPTRDSVAALNVACQTKRLLEGNLDETRAVVVKSVNPKTEQVTLLTLHPGDRVMMQQNSRPLDVNNGDTGTIVKIKETRRTPIVTVELDRGGLATLPLSDYPYLTLGYATTVHKGQGSTTTTAYNLLSGGMQDQQMTNVQLTRATHEVRVYASEQDVGKNISEIASRMKHSGEKTLATQIPRQPMPEEFGTNRMRQR